MRRSRRFWAWTTIQAALCLCVGSLLVAQETPWGEIGNPAHWRSYDVPLLIPGSQGVPATTKTISVKVVLTRPPIALDAFSIAIVPSADGDGADVMEGGSWFMPTPNGMVGVGRTRASLHLYDSYMKLAGLESGWIEQVATRVSPARLLGVDTARLRGGDAWHLKRHVPLSDRDTPRDFFGRYFSRDEDAETVAIDVQDGVLRLDLRSHTGQLGTFWVDIAAREVVRREFEPR